MGQKPTSFMYPSLAGWKPTALVVSSLIFTLFSLFLPALLSLPCHTYGIDCRDLKRAFLLMPVLEYIAQTWPFWNQTGGEKHIIPMEGKFLINKSRHKDLFCILYGG